MTRSWRTRSVRTLAAAPLALLTVLALPTAAFAHPLGNATVNHYDGLHLYPDRITDNAVEDIAEIPTYQRQRTIDDTSISASRQVQQLVYARAQCASLASSLSVRVNGNAVAMVVLSSSYQERPGAIGLRAGRLDCELTGSVDLTRPASLSFTDTWDSQGIGWHEITAVADGVALQHSPFPAVSISHALRSYPNDLLSSPLDVRSGTVALAPGGGPSSYVTGTRLAQAGPLGRALNSLTTTFNNLVGARHLTLGVGLLAVLLSLALGAGHAMLPGHGKTIMAAYLVGRRGRLRDVITVGATVTITHTAGVLLLGLAITATAAFAPTQAEQYLAAVSGLIIAGVGVGLLASAVRRARRHAVSDELSVTEPPSPVQYALAAQSATAAMPAIATAAAGYSGHPPTHWPVEHQHPHSHPDGHPDDDGHGHDGGHSHGHPHRHGHTHSHRAGAHQHSLPASGPAFSRAGLVGLGVAGGLVPSPSALLVLLAAIALGRTYFGIALVIGYGLGMAGSLSAAGLLLVKLRGRLDGRFGTTRPRSLNRALAVLPIMTALLVLTVGIGLTLRAVAGQI